MFLLTFSPNDMECCDTQQARNPVGREHVSAVQREGKGHWLAQQKPEWTCSRCSTNNFQERTQCRNCGLPKNKSKGKGKGKGKAQIMTTPVPAGKSGNVHTPPKTTPVNKTSLRRELTYKGAMMLHGLDADDDEEEEWDEDADMKDANDMANPDHQDKEKGEEDGDGDGDQWGLTEFKDWSETDLKTELGKLESVIVQSRSLKLSSGLEAMEQRAALMQIALSRQGPDGQQPDRADRAVKHAKKQIETTEKDIVNLEEKLTKFRSKLKEQQKKAEAAQKELDEVKARCVPGTRSVEAPCDAQALVQSGMTTFKANLPNLATATDPVTLNRMVEEAFRKTVTQLAVPALVGTEFPFGMPLRKATEQIVANQQVAHLASQQQAIPTQPVRGAQDGMEGRSVHPRCNDDDKADKDTTRGRSRSHGSQRDRGTGRCLFLLHMSWCFHLHACCREFGRWPCANMMMFEGMGSYMTSILMLTMVVVLSKHE